MYGRSPVVFGCAVCTKFVQFPRAGLLPAKHIENTAELIRPNGQVGLRA